MMMSRTSNTHTTTSIEPYEIGQDRSEATTAPRMVLTVSLGSNPSRNPTPLRQRLCYRAFKRDLSAAEFAAGLFFKLDADFTGSEYHVASGEVRSRCAW